MSNLAGVLKGEISRLSRKEVKKVQFALKAEITKLRKDISVLRSEVLSLKKENKVLRVVNKSSLTPAAAGKVTSDSPNIRPTAKSVKRLREKFGLGQDEFAVLCGVGRITISRWEQSEGRVVFRGAVTAERFAKVMQLGKNEALAELAALKGEPAPAPLKRGRKPAKKASKKAAGKKRGPGRPPKTKAQEAPASKIGKVKRRKRS